MLKWQKYEIKVGQVIKEISHVISAYLVSVVDFIAIVCIHSETL